MAYSTQREALAGGEIIYGTGRVSVIRSGNGFNYWPKQAGVAMDAVSNRVVADSLPTSKRSSVDAFAERIADRLVARQEAEELDALLRQVRAAMDDAQAEQEAQGTFSSEDEDKLRRGEVTGNDECMSFEESIAASAASSKAYWDGVKQRSRSTGNNAGYQHSKKTLGNKPVALDSVAVNAKAAKPYSMFAHPERMKRASQA